jgi:hypothetical protein
MRATGSSTVVPIAKAAANEIALGYHLTLEIMRGNQGIESNLGSLAQLVFTVVLLDQMGSKLARAEELQKARNAILFCHQAGVSSGTWSLDENGYEALRTIVKLFEQQLATSPLADFEEVNERLNDIFACGERAGGNRVSAA